MRTFLYIMCCLRGCRLDGLLPRGTLGVSSESLRGYFKYDCVAFWRICRNTCFSFNEFLGEKMIQGFRACEVACNLYLWILLEKIIALQMPIEIHETFRWQFYSKLEYTMFEAIRRFHSDFNLLRVSYVIGRI